MQSSGLVKSFQMDQLILVLNLRKAGVTFSPTGNHPPQVNAQFISHHFGQFKQKTGQHP